MFSFSPEQAVANGTCKFLYPQSIKLHHLSFRSDILKHNGMADTHAQELRQVILSHLPSFRDRLALSHYIFYA